MKWITSTDIKHWADTRGSQGLLPELVVRLIRATSTNINHVRFPSGDAIHLSGWDGVLDSNETIFNVSSGISLWECGVNTNPKDKANEDYSKRTNNPLGYDKTQSTFVFVTPRIWDRAIEWANEKKQFGEWKDVVVITAVELEEWLLMCPAIALWLTESISGKSIRKVYSIESYWNRWASGKNLKLNPSILLGGREKEQKSVYDNISKSSITIVQSMAQSESLAFAVACILESPDKYNLLSKCIVVEDEDILERLIDEYNNIVFIANVGQKNHMYAIQNDHCIIYAASAAESFNKTSDTNLIKLPLLDRDSFIKSLVKSGISREFAEQLSRETVRNITILRRSLELDYTCPDWAKPENVRDIIPAVLVSRWSEIQEGDKEIISLIAGEPYNSYIARLQKWVHLDDSPVVTIDGKWRLYSPYEAFGYISRYITITDFTNYKEAIHRITSDNDPDAIEKMEATGLHFWEHKQNYSGWIKEGLFQSAIMISLSKNEDTLNLPTLPSTWIDDIVSTILNNSSIEWWLSNRHVLELIAEASPKSYIRFIQDDLVKDNSIIRRLFIPKGNISFWGVPENYVEVLFSLQILLWSEEWLLPVSCILAELCGIKNGISLSNKPIEALYETYAIWMPQTYAKTAQRLQVLETLSKKYPNQMFGLYYKLLDKLDSAIVFCTHPMRWRCYNYTKGVVTCKEVRDSIQRLCKLVVSVCDESEEQICKLLNLANQKALGQENRDMLFEYIVIRKPIFIGNYVIINTIRNVIYRHKTCSDAKWALSKDEIHSWEVLLSELESENLLEKYMWIFEDSYVEIAEIDRKNLDRNEAFEQVRIYKNRVVKEIEQAYGFNGICKFVKMVGCPSEVGESYAYSADATTYQQVLDVLLVESEESIINFAKGFFRHYTLRNGTDSVISIFNYLSIDKYESIISIPLTVTPCACREMWRFIGTLPASVQNGYWKNLSIGFIRNEEVLFLVKKLNEYKRYDRAIDVIYHSHEDISIPASVIEEAIIGLISLSEKDVILKMHYELAKVVYILDRLEDADIQTLYSIELLLYRLLEQYENVNETKFVNEIMTNPHSMMEIIDKVYLSSDEYERAIELEKISDDNIYRECFYILSDIRRVPYVDKDNNIDEAALNNYICQLQDLGITNHKIDGVNTVIGELLGNYPEIENYPPLPICDIIEKHNNVKINQGFMTKIYNKRGVTVRPAFAGGTLENIESVKYKKYADKIRYTHPVVCRIFDDLSNNYYLMAKREDTKVKIEKMEF